MGGMNLGVANKVTARKFLLDQATSLPMPKKFNIATEQWSFKKIDVQSLYVTPANLDAQLYKSECFFWFK
jgi:hypothetical protein